MKRKPAKIHSFGNPPIRLTMRAFNAAFNKLLKIRSEETGVLLERYHKVFFDENDEKKEIENRIIALVREEFLAGNFHWIGIANLGYKGWRQWIGELRIDPSQYPWNRKGPRAWKFDPWTGKPR